MVRIHRRRIWTAFASAFAALMTVSGCAGTLDKVSSQRFRESPFTTLFHTDDPMYVLRNSQEGDARAQAMLIIKEPKSNGKSDDEQNELMKILSESATSDKQVYCRLNAIEALARFNDPRAAQILMTAYQNANPDSIAEELKPGDSNVIQASRRTRTALGNVTTFTPDMIIRIQCHALEALGKKRTPEALALLCEVAMTPAKKEAKVTEIELTQMDGSLGQDKSDLRLAAIRSLEHFKMDMQAARVLFKIMTTEREVAIKNRAYQSLIKVTDKDWPPGSPEWSILLEKKDTSPVSTQLRPKRGK